LVEPRHVALVRGSEQPVGLHTQLSIDTSVQNSLQRLLSCYTASAEHDCPQLDTKGDERYEHARVRMAGLALVDIPTGKVLAAVSAQSPCFLHDLTRTGQRPTDCPDLPLGTVHKPQWPQAPDNHALFKQAAPGSLVKPLLMSGILVGGGKYPGLDVALQKSDSHLFLDAWLCRKELGKGPFATDCDRPKQTQHIAHLLGWNSGCETEGYGRSNLHCGEMDLLWGHPIYAAALGPQTERSGLPSLSVMSGRLLVQPVQFKDKRWGYQDLIWPQSMPTAAQRADCANSARKIYTGCTGNRLGIVSEGYGQGNALTTPVGVSGLLSALANAAYQHPHQAPHLLVKVFRNDGKTLDWGSSPPSGDLKKGQEVLDPEIAKKIIAAMALTHKPGGTAHAACTGVWTVAECAGDLGIAGKTGTPGDADDRSIAQLQKDMLQRRACAERKDTDCLAKYPMPKPRYRWYAAIYKSPNSQRYDKAVTVLVHSNWRRSDGRFADDQNAAAEIGMQAIRMLRERRQ
jgi:cell division protein FtsI/penicillin-binding protein 2